MKPALAPFTSERRNSRAARYRPVLYFEFWWRAARRDFASVIWEVYMPWEGVDPAKLETDLYALLA